MMDFEKIDIRELLPQQEPFIMVGNLRFFSMEKTITGLTVTDSNIFVDDGKFTPAGLIENIAQTCATRIGYINKYILKKGIQIGFIGAIRGLSIYRLPKTGETIETTIETLEEVFGMTLVKAYVKAGDEILAESEMKIAVSDAESENTK